MVRPRTTLSRSGCPPRLHPLGAAAPAGSRRDPGRRPLTPLVKPSLLRQLRCL